MAGRRFWVFLLIALLAGTTVLGVPVKRKGKGTTLVEPSGEPRRSSRLAGTTTKYTECVSLLSSL